ncbi:hypothetical protein MJ923_10260 [Shewanella sp. 3B26]|uniref:Uncharacterized protein n=1 Tax=Shewanella zhuhaiensis TaxID=2919576 RepID=A0AAJ1F0K6_9GAMM|nr:hypothetical protein [Shewanella zhuhaiensis]MCH4294682.1 hypothetical protein [Shewanella zhuhaiensis]
MEIFVVFLVSILFRKSMGKPIVAPELDKVLYSDKWVSAHAFNIFQILGGARNCLWIKVTHESVNIAPHFPFSCFFLPEVWGCEWCFPKKDLVNVEENVLGVVVTYRHKGKLKQFRVFPTSKKGFVQAACS